MNLPQRTSDKKQLSFVLKKTACNSEQVKVNLRKQKSIVIFKTNSKDKQEKKHTCSKDRRQTEGGDKREKAKNRHRESRLTGNPSV